MRLPLARPRGAAGDAGRHHRFSIGVEVRQGVQRGQGLRRVDIRVVALERAPISSRVDSIASPAKQTTILQRKAPSTRWTAETMSPGSSRGMA